MRSTEPLVRSESEYFTYHPSAIASKVFLYPTSLGIFYYQKGYHLRRMRFDSILLMYIASGRCSVVIDGETRFALPGQFVLLDTYMPHEYSFPADSEVCWIHFDGPLARNYYELIFSMKGNIISSDDAYTLSASMSEIVERFRAGKAIHEGPMSASLTGILQSFLQNKAQEPNRFSRAAIIERSRSYISEHFAEPLSLEQLAEQSGLSMYHYSRVFSEETGMTPHQYLIAARISAAKMVLRTPSAPTVKEIAFSCGFNSESSFCSTFRKKEGISPKEYREKAFQV